MKRALLFLPLVGCPEPEPPPPAAPVCDLAYETLPGRSFVREIRGGDGSTWEADTWARARFEVDGAAFKVRYNTRSLADMYTYTCSAGKGELVCLQDGIDLQQWCQTLIANKGSCSVAELADLTGASVNDATKAYETLMPKVKKLSAAELEAMKAAFASPSNQLRGVFRVRIDAESCRLSVRDTYQTMTFGELREMDNYVGSSRFAPTTADLVFEHCADRESLVALEAPGASAKPGQNKAEWPAGATVPFRHVGSALARPTAGCIYSQDTFVNYAAVSRGAPVTAGADGKLAWTFDHAFGGATGRQVVHLYRYEACKDAAPALRDVSCTAVLVGP